ncbi:hypothetical protein C8P63_10944 [Melghirimyces profundicolus]|uniref:Uncharacterized protein n=1 Tax=Melghirimyces profundicolus TaxID=1242148 RepID=A0A2T6BW16_9BACL|nr:hypothetical protein C8P63_10944 [Melghirimyces profundicolus]
MRIGTGPVRTPPVWALFLIDVINRLDCTLGNVSEICLEASAKKSGLRSSTSMTTIEGKTDFHPIDRICMQELPGFLECWYRTGTAIPSSSPKWAAAFSNAAPAAVFFWPASKVKRETLPLTVRGRRRASGNAPIMIARGVRGKGHRWETIHSPRPKIRKRPRPVGRIK